MSDAIAEAIREHWGEKCGEFEPECPTCQVWAEFAELSRLSALVAEWQKAAEPFAKEAAGWADLWGDDHFPALHPYGNVCENCGEEPGCDTARFNIGGLRRLSQLKDTTNADK